MTAGSAAPTLRADVSGPAALPDEVPEVAWRGGIDLNPLDAADPETCRWLLTLVWPEHQDRRARLELSLLPIFGGSWIWLVYARRLVRIDREDRESVLA